MFGNAREIKVNDIVMFHERTHGNAWVGIVREPPARYAVDKTAVFVRWWYESSRAWSDSQRIPTSMLHLIGPVPIDAEWDV